MSLNYSIFTKPPLGFHATVEVASCFCECEGKILLLKRHPQKSQGNTWGVPAGKMEKNETPVMTIIREVAEEIGLTMDSTDLQNFGLFYCRLPHIDYVYHLFYKKFTTFPVIQLELSENVEMKWLTLEEAFHYPLIAGGTEFLNYYKKIFVDKD